MCAKDNFVILERILLRFCLIHCCYTPLQNDFGEQSNWTQKLSHAFSIIWCLTKVLYMSFDRFLWLLSPVIYLKLTRVLYECLLSQAEWWVAELLFLSLNNWGLNFLQNKCSQSSQIYLSPEKLRKVFTFQSCKFLNDKIDQNINFAKLPSAK